MTATAVRRRAAHLGPERRRPQVLDAALEIAVRKGLGAVNVGAVAKQLGVTRPVVYSCFPGRVELVEALLEREGASLVSAVLEALHSSGGFSDPEQAFVQGFRALMSSAASQPMPWRLILAGEPDPALSAHFRDARALVKEHATAWIRPAMAQWWHTADLDRKLPVLIEFFLASCEAAVRTVISGESPWEPEELGEFVGRAVFRAFEGS